jgi:phosphate transport system protein
MLLEKHLERLNILLISMADVVQDNIYKSVSIYNDNKYFEKIEINDDIVDDYERKIEEECLNILIKEKLYAKDLRKVSGILKIITDLERIGDHASDIYEVNLNLKTFKKVKVESIDYMVNTALTMFKDSIMCFINEDLDLAKSIILKDEVVDKYYKELLDYFIVETKNNKMSSAFAIYTTLIVKYIERIADHAVNIAEWVVYISSGFHKDKQIF